MTGERKESPARVSYSILRVKGQTTMDRSNVQALRALAAKDGLQIVQKRIGRTNQTWVWLVHPQDPTTMVTPDRA